MRQPGPTTYRYNPWPPVPGLKPSWLFARTGITAATRIPGIVARSGAIVFDTGTMGWELPLEPVPSASPDAPRVADPRVGAITRNLLAHVLGHPSATGRNAGGSSGM
jgi:hypothetical protein